MVPDSASPKPGALVQRSLAVADHLIALAKKDGLEIIERRIMPEELSTFNECFIVGSAAEVTPVSEIGPYTFKPGNMSRTMMDAYSNLVRA